MNANMKKVHYLLFLALILNAAVAVAQRNPLKNANVLVYTKNGSGYVHDNIPSAVEAVKKLAEENNFKVTVSDDPAIFTEENLKQYVFLVFPSTNNDVFANDQQRLAFRRYIEAGVDWWVSIP